LTTHNRHLVGKLSVMFLGLLNQLNVPLQRVNTNRSHPIVQQYIMTSWCIQVEKTTIVLC